jgi:hypothetical protein
MYYLILKISYFNEQILSADRREEEGGRFILNII